MEQKLPFAFRNNILVDITTVENGLSCNCFCPVCGGRLIARKGDVRREHFAHYNTKECKGALETSIHLAAKEIFLLHKKIRLPQLVVSPSVTGSIFIKLMGEIDLEFNDVKTEKRRNDIIPDIIAKKGGDEFFIEIALTHFVDPNKINKIKTLNTSTLEIDLSDIDREINYDTLEKYLINNTENKFWIYSKKVEKFYNQFEKYIKVFEINDFNGKKSISKCPLTKKFLPEDQFVYVDECAKCDYRFGFFEDIRKHFKYIKCLGYFKKQIDEIYESYYKNNQIIEQGLDGIDNNIRNIAKNGMR